MPSLLGAGTVRRDAWRSALSRQMDEANGKKMQKARSMEERTIASCLAKAKQCLFSSKHQRIAEYF